ncbi:MAG: DUF503 domain-containing protein [Firmicutes bacterium]|nr:DUF503 domain-containing protein [Bacillota bacterium]
MVIGCCILRFSAEWVTSLKEKRMVVKSLVEKTKHKFNISAAEVDSQDVHQTIVIGIACVSNDAVHANQMIDTVVDFMEYSTDAVLENTDTQIIRV